jgi:peroxiredoxin
MSDMKLGELKSAPNFELTDFEGRQVRLSDYKGARHVVLIFNRGFV